MRRYCDEFEASEEVRDWIDGVVRLVRLLKRIEAGEVPPMPADRITGLVVRSSEIVWHQSTAATVERKRQEEQRHEGQVSVTSVRIVFTSRTQPDEMSIDAINAVETETDRIVLIGRSQRASWELLVPNPVLTAAYIRHAIRVFHRQVDVGFEQGKSRHLSQEVKQAVWQRDGGKCVECGAEDYLEFDHIIPVAKGGANTAENIQLLCRRCNLKKSDRL